MSIFTNNNGERSRKAVFSRSNSGGSAATVSIIIALMLLASGFVFLSPATPMTITTAFAQEGNSNNATAGGGTTSDTNTTIATINGDADNDTDGSVQGAAEEEGNGNISSSTTTTTAASFSSLEMELSAQPIYEERSPEGNMTPINQTHGIFTFSGNGTLTLPNTTETINTTNNGTAIISFTTSSGYGKETIRTENGETVTATLSEIVQFNPAAPEAGGRGIVTAVFQTNSTGMLAPLNGMIAAGIDDMSSSGESHVTLWRWESGISSNSSGVAPAPVQ